MNIFISDITGPFFIFSEKNKNINWSKIPFNDLEKNSEELDDSKTKKIIKTLGKYIKILKSIGFNAVTIDNLSHLVAMDFYSKKLKAKLRNYKEFYKKIFKIIKNYDLKIFVKTDYMFFNKEIELFIKSKKITEKDLFYIYLEKLFKENKNIDGLIIRIGESDGVDVKDDFKSKISIFSPNELNKLIKKILPLFEKHNKLLILRNWTIGIGKIGDLIWNEITLQKSLKSIESENFYLSMKYAETDFFKGVPLSRLIFKTNHKKIIEFQARREYEGFGKIPNFIGWDYQNYLKELKKDKKISGIWVWPSEGGWSSFKNIFCFINNKSSIWNELNTFTTIKLAKENWSVKKCVFEFYRKFINRSLKKYEEEKFLKILFYSDYVIKKGFYIEEIVNKTIFFHRFKFPPLLFPIWQYATINDFVFYLLNYFVRNKNKAIEDSKNALKKIKLIEKISKEINLKFDINFYYDTFYLFYLVRKIIFSKKPEINYFYKKLDTYYKKYQDCFYFNISYSKNFIKSFIFKLIIRLFLRKKKQSILNKILINKITIIFLKKIFKLIKKENFIINKIGMPLDYFFID